MIKRFALLFILAAGGCTVQKPPMLIPFADGEYWVLGNDLVYTIGESGHRIVVPRGFVTDFASVPRIFWTFFPRHGEYTRAAIVHDFLYWEQKCTREQADELFDIVMAGTHVDSTSRFTIYAAVRVWGNDAWEENAVEKEQGYVRIIPERYIDFPVMTRWENYREYLRTTNDGDERQAAYPGSSPSVYCGYLEKEDSTEKAGQAPVEDRDDEPEPAPEPPMQPLPESAIGA